MSSIEYGLFNDEGCVERGFCSVHEAEEALAECYSPDDSLVAMALCDSHDEQPAQHCEECAREEEVEAWRPLWE